MAERSALVSVILVFLAVSMGLFAAQYYVWGAPTGVNPMVHEITLEELEASVDSSGSRVYGEHPTPLSPAVPARDASTGENAIMYLLETYDVTFRVDDTDAQDLDDDFMELKVTMSIYSHDLEGAPLEENVVLNVVQGGTGQANIENSANSLSEGQWDVVVTVDYTTRSSQTPSSGSFPIYMYAEES